MYQNALLNWMVKLYSFVVLIGSNLQSALLLYMRVTWGHQFFKAGLSKLNNLPATIQFFTALHFPTPTFHAYTVSILEVVAGFCLFVGFASRLAAIPLIVIMLTALSTAHAAALASFRFILEPHILVIQQPYPYLITALMVLAFGPGRISIDGWLKRWVGNQPKY